MPRFPHQQQRLFLNGQLLEDWKELSDYGITAATSSKLKLALMIVEDPSPANIPFLPCKRRDEDGARFVIRLAFNSKATIHKQNDSG